MKAIGIYYGTTQGVTTGIVDEVEFYLRKVDYEIHDVADGIDGLENYENLILITPTYGVGELEAHWEAIIEDFKKIDFTGKVIGLIGLGNQFAFGESYVGALKILYDIIIKNGGKIVGMTSTEGYGFQESEAIVDDKFVGLALDETNQGELTPDRVEAWMEDVLPKFN